MVDLDVEELLPFSECVSSNVDGIVAAHDIHDSGSFHVKHQLGCATQFRRARIFCQVSVRDGVWRHVSGLKRE
jgi:hypothetical protein